jgi:hypothetical protein
VVAAHTSRPPPAEVANGMPALEIRVGANWPAGRRDVNSCKRLTVLFIPTIGSTFDISSPLRLLPDSRPIVAAALYQFRPTSNIDPKPVSNR